MGKVPRVDVKDLVYHAWNRGNASGKIFLTNKDYLAFENIIRFASIHIGMRILAYCIMPNHWHFVLQPREDGDLARFFQWLTLTHTQRWHAVRGSAGQGHIYQGRYKSNICESNEHFLRLVRYVERNALRAGLAKRAEDWRWSSAWLRKNGTQHQKKLLHDWPVTRPANYADIVNEPESDEELLALRTALQRGRPYGADEWTGKMVEKYKLEASFRPRGRPWKQTN